jgi:hypothetical protein
MQTALQREPDDRLVVRLGLPRLRSCAAVEAAAEPAALVTLRRRRPVKHLEESTLPTHRAGIARPHGTRGAQ